MIYMWMYCLKSNLPLYNTDLSSTVKDFLVGSIQYWIFAEHVTDCSDLEKPISVWIIWIVLRVLIAWKSLQELKPIPDHYLGKHSSVVKWIHWPVNENLWLGDNSHQYAKTQKYLYFMRIYSCPVMNNGLLFQICSFSLYILLNICVFSVI